MVDTIIYTLTSITILCCSVFIAIGGDWFALFGFLISVIFGIMAGVCFRDYKRRKELKEAYDRVEKTPKHQAMIKKLSEYKEKYQKNPTFDNFTVFNDYKQYCEQSMIEDIKDDMECMKKTEQELEV